MEIFSEYLNHEHALSKIDARVKLIVVLAVLVMVLTCKGILFPLLIAAISLLLCLKMRISARVILLRYSQPLFIAVIVLLLKCLFTGEAGYKDGFIEGAKIFTRIIGGVSLLVVLGFATPFPEFIGALSWLRVPKPFIEIMMFAYRYVFVLLEDASTIYNAQKNRLGYTNIRKGLKSFGVLTGALVLRGFDQSQKTSEAMMQRGYTGDMPVLKGLPLRMGEVIFAAALIICAGAIWMI